jgi:Tfp pilus assembly protein FimT
MRGKHARAFFVPASARTLPSVAARAASAFTLVELALVLCIIGVIAALAAPRYGSAIARQRADGAASRIASDLAYARALARMTSASVTVTFNPSQRSYTIPTARNPLLGTPAPYSVDVSASPYQGAMLGGAATAASSTMPSTGSATGTFSLSFDGFGEPTAIGWVIVQSGEWSRKVSMDSSARTTITRLDATAVRALLP